MPNNEESVLPKSIEDAKSVAAVVNVVIGQTRIADAAGNVGTIMYKGPVASSKTTKDYYGIAWDDPTRGKHNGTVVCRTTKQLVQHFRCAHPTGASFCLPHTVQWGRPLTHAVVLERYQQQVHEQTSLELQQHTVRTVSGRTKPIEFVGHEKIVQQQQLEKLSAISLRRMLIHRVESFQGLDHIQQIDLGGNLLSDWADVEQLLHSFPKLERLSLACNRLVVDSTGLLQPGTANNGSEHLFKSLTHLNLRGTSESWKTLRSLACVFPNLQELCCAYCSLHDLSADEAKYGLDEGRPVFVSLQFLDVTGCMLDEVLLTKLARFIPNVESLSLDENPIAKWPDTLAFQRLEHVQLAHTEIQRWEDIEALNKLSIQSLRLRHCPLLKDMGELQARSLVLARFPTLTKFNASNVSMQERQEAERHYVLSVSRDLQHHQNVPNEEIADEASREKILSQHPQYTHLLDKYPDLAARIRASHDSRGTSCTGSGRSSLLADSIMNVSIRSLAAQSCTMDPLVRRLPRQLTIGRLKALCARQFGLDIDLQVLSCCQQSSSLPIVMPDDDRNLAFYGVSDGAEIIMNEIDAKALEQERLREQLATEERIKKQERQMTQFQEQKKLAVRQGGTQPMQQEMKL